MLARVTLEPFLGSAVKKLLDPTGKRSPEAQTGQPAKVQVKRQVVRDPLQLHRLTRGAASLVKSRLGGAFRRLQLSCYDQKRQRRAEFSNDQP